MQEPAQLPAAAKRERTASPDAQRFKLALLDELAAKTTAKACLLALRGAAQTAALVAALLANGEFAPRRTGQRAYFVAWVAAWQHGAALRHRAHAMRAQRMRAVLHAGALSSLHGQLLHACCARSTMLFAYEL